VIKGRCRYFNVEKGFGFIARDDGGPDAFLHRSLLGSQGDEILELGAKVEVEVVDTEKGPRAIRLERIG
jgi:cold shock protein